MKEVTFKGDGSYIKRNMKLFANIESGYCTRGFLKGIVLFLFLFIIYVKANAQNYSIPDPNFKQCILENYPTLIDSMGNLKVDNARTLQGALDCSNRNIKDISGIEYFKGIWGIKCNNNQLSSIPSLAGYDDLLREFNCSNNRLSELPEFRNGAVNLSTIKCSNNLLYTLPDLNHLINLDSLSCENNYLSFGDLLNVPTTVMNFLYAPQNTVQVNARVETEEDGTYTFAFPEDDTVSTSSYKLFKNGILFMDLFNKDTFTVLNVKPSDAGFYSWQATNNVLPDLTLSTTLQEMVVINKNNKAFTPDGNNNNDRYYIPCNGTSRIYNKFGRMVKEFQGTAYWDGTDLHGNPLPSGAYILRCGEESEQSVTLIR